MSWPRVSSLKTIELFQARLREPGSELPIDQHLRGGLRIVVSQLFR